MLGVVLVELDEGGAAVSRAGRGGREGVGVVATLPQADSRAAHASKLATAFMHIRVMRGSNRFVREEPERAPPCIARPLQSIDNADLLFLPGVDLNRFCVDDVIIEVHFGIGIEGLDMLRHDLRRT